MKEFKKLKKQKDSRLQQVPSAPDSYYKNNGWTNWFDFLGIEETVSFVDYNEASQIVQNLSLKEAQEFLDLKTQHDPRLQQVPLDPDTFYKDKGWINWSSFLGRKKLSYEDAEQIVQSLSLQNIMDFIKLKKQHDPRLQQVPFAPNVIYVGKGWVNWDTFLGN